MYVVLDTCAIYRDFYLRNQDTQFLLEQAPLRNLLICLPEIAVQEMLDDYRSELQKAQKQSDSARNDLIRLLDRKMPEVFTKAELEAAVAEYEAKFRELLKERGVHILPVPAAESDVQKLLCRYFAKQKPFDDNRRGMCDALIWESVLELCRKQIRPIALITNDAHFADASESRLHPHLLADLKDVGLLADLEEVGVPAGLENPGNSELHKSIADFKESRLKPLKSAGEGGMPPGLPAEPPGPSVGPEPSLAPATVEPVAVASPPEQEVGTEAEKFQEPATIQPPKHSPEEEFILQNPVSEARKKSFLKDFRTDRQKIATTEMLFERTAVFHRESIRPKGLVHSGFNVLLLKGPFVDRSNWLDLSSWEFAVAMERHLLNRLEQALRGAAEDRLGPAVNRDAPSVVGAFDAMVGELQMKGYSPSLFVLAGALGTQLHVDLIRGKALALKWTEEVQKALRTTHRILGMYAGIPILDIPDSPSPAVYVVDLACFATLNRYGEEPEFSIEDVDRARAEKLLTLNPKLISNPPPGSGLEEERIRQLQLRVGLKLWETYELRLTDRDAVVGRPLFGPVVDAPTS